MTDNFKNPIASTDEGVTSLASIITQVDRDGNPSTTEKLTVQSTQYNNTVVPSNNNSRYKASYMLELFFSCCNARSDVVDNQSSVSVNNIELSVAASQSSPTVIQSQKYHNNLNNNNSSVGVHGLPVKMPDMGYPDKSGKKCLVLDLDETLVHSSFQPVPQANYVIPVNIDGTIHNVYVIKRPGVDSFMHQVSEFYEIVIYTASLSKYADPLLDKLDVHKVIKKRLFRENCVLHDGHYVKDLSLLNRYLLTHLTCLSPTHSPTHSPIETSRTQSSSTTPRLPTSSTLRTRSTAPLSLMTPTIPSCGLSGNF